nr:IS1595 family transposase [Actinomyces ruminicola]
MARLRSAMGQEGAPLSGRVEVDETYIGGPRPGSAGRGAAGKVLVAGAIETGSYRWGRARLRVVPDASKESLGPFLSWAAAPGSTVVTDAWASYPPLMGPYTHEIRSVRASGRPAHEELPAVHRLFALMDHFLAGAYRGSASREHLDSYLDEFVFRFNRRSSRHRGLVFLRLLQRAVSAPPTRYQDLTAAARPGNPTAAGRTGPRSRPGTLEGTITNYPWHQPH